MAEIDYRNNKAVGSYWFKVQVKGQQSNNVSL
jgi:hypothetical protein